MNKKHPIMLFLLTILLTILSANSQACTVAPDPDLNNDGIVDKNDLVIVTRSNGLKTSHPRYNPQADTNCDGKVNPTDIHFVNKALGETFSIGPEVSGVISSRTLFSFRLGEKEWQAFDFRFSSKDRSAPFTLQVNQSISPAEGLTLTEDLSGTEIYDDDENGYIREKMGQRITATQTGKYTITTTVTVLETGKVFSKISIVKVYKEDNPMLSFEVNLKRLLPVDFAGSLLVVVGVSGDEEQLNQISSVKLKQLETDDTFSLDFVNSQSGYRIGVYRKNYNGNFTVDTEIADRCFQYVVEIENANGFFQSEKINKVCITGFPIGYNREKRNATIEPITGRIFANNLLLLQFQPDTSEQRMREIAEAVDGKIIGQSSPFYQLELLHPVSLFQNLDEIMDQLRVFPDVLLVGADMKTGQLFSSSIANDPIYIDGLQPNLDRIRADEAWFVTQGSDSLNDKIAVIDTGINFAHEEFSGRIINGHDYIAPNTISDDAYYHGTHVAGIIGASTGNNKGIAGIAPKNFLQAVKVAEFRSMWYSDIADAIKWSAGLSKDNLLEPKAPIINVSAGSPEKPTSDQIEACEEYREALGRIGPCDPQVAKKKICSAVTAAVSNASLVVAAVGNDAKNAKQYPAACSDTIAVGATELYNDERWVVIGDTNLTFAEKYFWVFGDIYTFFNSDETIPDGIGVAAGSNYGDWVDLAAPGNSIYSSVPSIKEGRRCSYGGDYDCANGTSAATPHVSGALALLLARHPEWKEDVEGMEKAVIRLRDTAKPLPDAELGAGRIDVFEAVFNGNFELVKPDTNEPEEWEKYTLASKACESKQAELGLLPVDVEHNQRMLVCDNTAVFSVGSMNTIDLPEGVTELPISFDWRIVGEDLDLEGGLPGKDIPYCNSAGCIDRFMPRNDFVLVQLIKVIEEGGTASERTTLLRTSLVELDSSKLTPNATNGWLQTDWQHFSETIPITTGAGKYTLRIQMYHSGFTSFDPTASISQEGVTLFMMDQLRFREI